MRKILIHITRYSQANSKFADKLTNFNFIRYSPTRWRSRCDYFVVFVQILFRGYMTHNLLLCLAHFALLANATIIMYSPVSVHCISTILIFWAPWLYLGEEIDIGAHRLFYTEFNSQQLLSEAFFHGMRIFGGIES